MNERRDDNAMLKNLILTILLLVVGCKDDSAKQSAAPPAPPTMTQSAPRPTNIVSREEWGSEPQPFPESRKHTPKYVTIHHAGVVYKPGTDPAKFVKNMQSWGQK